MISALGLPSAPHDVEHYTRRIREAEAAIPFLQEERDKLAPLLENTHVSGVVDRWYVEQIDYLTRKIARLKNDRRILEELSK